MRALLLLAVVLGACNDETCNDCVRRCAPFAVVGCSPSHMPGGIDVSCACDTSRRVERP
jgi:hypothetical protein